MFDSTTHPCTHPQSTSFLPLSFYRHRGFSYISLLGQEDTLFFTWQRSLVARRSFQNCHAGCPLGYVRDDVIARETAKRRGVIVE
jgi:hypothetical protein